MFRIFICVFVFVFFTSSYAGDIFQQSKTPHMGGGSGSQTQQVQTQVNTGQDSCSALANERRAIQEIDEKQIWVPIEQQNANYYRMRFLKSQMAALGCRY